MENSYFHIVICYFNLSMEYFPIAICEFVGPDRTKKSLAPLADALSDPKPMRTMGK